MAVRYTVRLGVVKGLLMSMTDVVSVEVRLLEPEYEALLRGAEESGLAPNDFVRYAIADEIVLAPVRKRGSRVMIRPRFGRMREVSISG